METLQEVPTNIDTSVLDTLRTFLQKHGAIVDILSTQQYDAHFPDGRTEERETNTCKVRFPAGTLRKRDGFSTSFLEPFIILFPDGTTLKARKQYPLNPEQTLQIILLMPLNSEHA